MATQAPGWILRPQPWADIVCFTRSGRVDSRRKLCGRGCKTFLLETNPSVKSALQISWNLVLATWRESHMAAWKPSRWRFSTCLNYWIRGSYKQSACLTAKEVQLREKSIVPLKNLKILATVLEYMLTITVSTGVRSSSTLEVAQTRYVEPGGLVCLNTSDRLLG